MQPRCSLSWRSKQRTMQYSKTHWALVAMTQRKEAKWWADVEDTTFGAVNRDLPPGRQESNQPSLETQGDS